MNRNATTHPATPASGDAAPSHPGRPPIYATEEARKEARRAQNRRTYSSPEYKAQRRARYQTDPAYRAECLERTRNAKLAAEAPAHAAYKKQVTGKLKRLPAIGKAREIRPIGGEEWAYRLACSVDELAQVICRPPSVIRAWIASDRWPRPNHEAKGGPRLGVYTDGQTAALAKATIDCLRIPTAHLTATKTDAIARLHRAMAAN